MIGLHIFYSLQSLSCESYLREPIIVKLLTSEIWFDGIILALSAYVSGKIFIKKKTSIALQLRVFVLPKPYVDLLDTNLYTYVPCCYIELHQTL
jgi:hypothetical protein